MIFYPKGYFNKVSDITLEYINKNNIKGILLDVDNTLIDYYRNVSEETIQWVKLLKANNIKMCILSNSENKEKMEELSEKLDLQYVYLAFKPFKRGFKKAKKILMLDNNNEIAVVGDQIFTDVIGANRMKMHSILVDPIAKKDIWLTLIKRPLENYIKKKIKNTKEI